MKYKKRVALISLAAMLLVGFGIYAFINQEKKAYDYSDFYVPVESEKTTTATDTRKEPEEQIQVLSLDLLKQRNKDVVGIIEFDERMIYEPIVQASDNDYYVRRNIDLNYASAGIPFISYDGNINSTNIVVYGHSSTTGNIIFTPLMNYLEKNFYLAHPTFNFILPDEVRTYQIVSVLNIDLDNLNDSLEFTKSSWRNQDSYASFLRSVKEDAVYETEESISTNDKLMTLVTCDTRDGNSRVVVVAKEITQ